MRITIIPCERDQFHQEIRRYPPPHRRDITQHKQGTLNLKGLIGVNVPVPASPLNR